jgi:hypothetical protein
MAHPNGGQENSFNPKHSFAEAYAFVGIAGVNFRSTTGEHIHAQQGRSKDGATLTIVFRGERNRHGSACKACWGFRVDCNQARIGQCAEALDSAMKGTAVETPPSRHPEKVGRKIKEPPSVSADNLNAWRRQLVLCFASAIRQLCTQDCDEQG